MVARRTALSLGFTGLVLALAASAFAQFDPQHNHLKCYKISGSTFTTNASWTTSLAWSRC